MENKRYERAKLSELGLKHNIVLEVSGQDFMHALEREPKSARELLRFFNLMEKALSAQVDWGVLCSVVAEEFR